MSREVAFSAARDVCGIVLIKDLRRAKERLASVLPAAGREALARDNARRALQAASVVGQVMAVTSSDDAEALAREAGVSVIVRDEGAGQNAAANAGISRALELGAKAVLIVSSDLPSISASALSRMLSDLPDAPCVKAAAADGRGGTNALYLSPPDAIALHFGDDSLRKFREAARENGLAFSEYRSSSLAFDIDEPDDLERLELVPLRA